MQTIRIFVSSPGDVGEERQAAGRVIERLQGKYWSFVRLDDVFWEEKVVRSTAHYQDELENPGNCDIVIGILWSRVGSPLPAKFQREGGGEPLTGTTWELEEAFAAFEASAGDERTPDIVIYRGTRPRPVPEEPEQVEPALEQGRKLDAYLAENYFFPDGTIKRPVSLYGCLEDFEAKLTANLEELILRKIPSLKPGFEPPPISGSPFKGLQPFTFQDSDRYFGRNREILELQGILRARAQKGLPFVLIYGASGYGKSSLMRAGLAPVITRPGGALDGMAVWRSISMQPALGEGSLLLRLVEILLKPPTDEEAEAMRHAPDLPLLRLPEAEALWLSAEEMVSDFAEEETREAAAMKLAELLERLDRHLLVQIDQLEEVFTTPGITAEERDAFFRTLAEWAATGRVWVVATMRSEYFPRIAEEAALRALVGKDGGYILSPPDRQSLREIIRFPALAARLDYQRRLGEVVIAGEKAKSEYLDEQILADAEASSDVLPLLEFTLQRLYDERSGSLLVWDSYASFGGLKGAIAHRANDAYATLDAAAKESRHLLFASLLRVDISRGTVIRQRALLDVLRENPAGAAFIEAFLAAHLLVTDEEQGRAVITLVHESLISHWDELAGWVDAHRGDLLARQRLREQAQLWLENGRQKSYLLSEARLAEAQRVGERKNFPLDGDEREFLRLSGRRAKGKLRFFQGAAVVFALLAIGAGVAGWWAKQQEKAAILSRNQAEEIVKMVVIDLQDKLQPIGRLDIMADIQKMVSDYYAQLSIDENNAQQVLNLAQGLANHGNLLLDRGDAAGGRAMFEQALTLNRRLVEMDPKDLSSQLFLSSALTSHGRACFSEGKLESSIKSFEEAVEICRRLAKENPHHIVVHLNLSIAAIELGNAYSERGRLGDAYPLYDMAVKIRETILKHDPNDADAKRRLAVALSHLGGAMENDGQLDLSAEIYSRGLKLMRELVELDPLESNWRTGLGVALKELGSVLENQGKLVESVAHYEEALEIARKQVEQDPTNTGWKKDLANALDDLGGAVRRAGDSSRAAEYYGEMLALAKEMSVNNPTDAQWRNLRVIALERSSRVEHARGRLDLAAAGYQEALEISELLTEEDRTNQPFRNNRRRILNDYASVLLDQGKKEDAERYSRDALEIARDLEKESVDNPGRRNDLGWAYFAMATVCSSQGRLDDALAHTNEALGIFRKLVDLAPHHLEWRADMLRALARTGEVMMAKGDYAGAKAACDEVLELRRKLLEEDPANGWRARDLVISLDQSAKLLAETGDTAGAQLHYEESLELSRKLMETQPDNPGYRWGLFAALTNSGQGLAALGRALEAEKRYDEALTLIRGMIEDAPDNLRWRDQMAITLKSVADLKQASGDLAGARRLVAEQLDERRRLLEQMPDDLELQRNIGISLDGLADIAWAQGEKETAYACMRESIGRKRDLIGKDPSHVIWRGDLVFTLSSLAQRLERTDAEGLRLAQEAVDLSRKLVEEVPHNLVFRVGLGTALGALGDLRRSAGELESSRMAAEECLEVYRGIVAASPQMATYQDALVSAISRVADLDRREERYGEGVTLMKEAQTLQSALVEKEPGNIQWRKNLGWVHERMGNMELDRGQPEEARAQYEEAIRIRAKLVEDAPDNGLVRHDLMLAYVRAAELLSEGKEHAESARIYRRAIEVSDEMQRRQPEDRTWLADRAAVLRRLGIQLYKAEEFAEAEQVQTECLEVRKQIASATTDAGSTMGELEITYKQLADVKVALGKKEEAAGLFHQALAISRERSAHQPDNREAKVNLLVSWHWVASLSPVADALPVYDEALGYLEHLLKSEPEDPEWRQRYSDESRALAEVLWAAGEKEEAQTKYGKLLEFLRGGKADAKGLELLESALEAYGLKQAGDSEYVERKKIADERVALCRKLVELSGDASAENSRLMHALNWRGRIYLNAGDDKEAEASFMAAEERSRHLMKEDPDSLELKAGFATSLAEVADVYARRDDVPRAEVRLRESISVRREMLKRNDNPEANDFLSIGLYQLAVLLSKNGKEAEAEGLFHESINHSRKAVAAEEAVPFWKYQLWFSLGGLADVLEPRRAYKELEELYREKLAVISGLIQMAPENGDFQQFAVDDLNDLGDVLDKQGRTADSGKEYEEAISRTRRMLEASPQDEEWQSRLRTSLDRMGLHHMKRGALEDAEKVFRESVEAQRRTYAKQEESGSPRNLAVTLYRMANVLVARGMHEAAAAAYDESLPLIRKALEEQPRDARLRSDLAAFLSGRADVAVARGEWKLARRLLGEAMTLRKKLLAETPKDANAMESMAGLHRHFAQLAWAEGNGALALSSYAAALPLSRRAVALEPEQPRHREELALILSGEGMVSLSRKRLSDAGKKITEARAIRQELVMADPLNRDLKRELGVVLNLAADAALKAEEADQWLAESLAISRELTGISPGNVIWSQDLCVVLYLLGRRQAATGRAEPAAELFQEALERVRKLESEGVLATSQQHWPVEFSAAMERLGAAGKLEEVSGKIWNPF